MTVGIKVGSNTEKIGSPAFLHAFFSTISGNLEPNGWGSKFPSIMNKLYQGSISPLEATAAIEELCTIQKELLKLPPDKVIWDIKDKSRQPPWGKTIPKEITSLSNYFITTGGHDLVLILLDALEDAMANTEHVEIVQC